MILMPPTSKGRRFSISAEHQKVLDDIQKKIREENEKEIQSVRITEVSDPRGGGGE